MIEKLSDFLRSSLNTSGQSYSTLREEFETIAAYLEVEEARFGERFRVEYSIPSDVEHAVVPSFIFQPLVENAIKHAVAPAMRPVTLRISARASSNALIVVVSDDGSGASPARFPGAGVGLANVRTRLAILYGESGTLTTSTTDEGYYATLSFPLRFGDPGGCG